MKTSRAFSTPLLIGITGVIVLIGIGAFALRDNGETDSQSDTPREVTLTGTTVCLPHQDTSGPQTLECAFGLQTEDGSYYTLDTRAVDGNILADFESGAHLTVAGMLTPRDALTEGNPLLVYDIAGVIAATTVEHVDEQKARHVVTGGTLAFVRPIDFGLAVRGGEQISNETSIPPCSTDFDYCLYYTGSTYEDTNFKSAGLRITERADLSTESQCLETAPAGYTALEPEITREDTYAVSVFASLSDAGAGSASEGALYRLSHNGTCHEFETRIGTTQFANYPAGTLTEFTETDRSAVRDTLRDILARVAFTDGRGVVAFPEVPN